MPIGEIILHVGMHKTGTTSIQQAFQGYDDGRIAYADLQIPWNMTPNHGTAIETLFRTDFEHVSRHLRYGRGRRAILRYRRQFQAKLDQQLARPLDRLILSGEGIPRLNWAELTTLRDRLLGAADKVTVLVYIREPVGFSLSMFQQRCKAGTFGRAGRLPAPQYRYKFKKFIKVFGKRHVQFVHYDKAALIGGSSVDDFAHRVGVTDIPSVQRANIGLSADATRCLYTLGQDATIDFTRPDAKLTLASLLQPLRDGMPGPALRLDPGMVAAQIKPRDVAWINRVTGFGFTLPDTRAGSLSDIDAALRNVSAEGHAQLRAILGDQGQTFGPQATVVEMMQGLYAARFHSTGPVARLRRGFRRLATGPHD